MPKPSARKINEKRYIVEYGLLEDEHEYALVTFDEVLRSWFCRRCKRETCEHARMVRDVDTQLGDLD